MILGTLGREDYRKLRVDSPLVYHVWARVSKATVMQAPGVRRHVLRR